MKKTYIAPSLATINLTPEESVLVSVSIDKGGSVTEEKDVYSKKGGDIWSGKWLED